MEIKKLADLSGALANAGKRTLVAVNAVDEHSVEAVAAAVEKGWVDAVLTGDENRIRQVCQRLKIAPGQFRIVHAETQDQAASLAARVVNSVPDALLMKGLVNTDKFMHILLNKEYNLFERGNVLSHVCVVENPHYPKLLVVSDVAIIPYPTLEQKKQMILYVSKVAQAMGIARPKVALIAPTEQVLTVLPACTDAAAIMTGRELFFPAVVDGPFALDVAIDAESAKIKGIHSEVAGDADCLLFPNIDAGNVFYKMNAKMCHSRQAAVVIGARVPVVLSSRGDDAETKLNSIALASLLCK